MTWPALVAFVVTAGLCPPIIGVLYRRRILDVPNVRSLHRLPAPRGGGLAVAAGILVAAFTVSAGSWRTPLVFASAGLAMVGLADDVRDLPVMPRLLAQLGISGTAVAMLLSVTDDSLAVQAALVTVATLWVVSYLNAFNFMDGINGIAAAQAIVAGAAWWAIGSHEHVGALAFGGSLALGAALGFAPFNFPSARVFLGDVGSYFLGAWLALVAVVGIREGVPVEAIIAPLGPGLADTAYTLICRYRRGQRLSEAHREHAYQRLVQVGWSHTRTTLVVGSLCAACAGLGAVSLTTAPGAVRLAADALLMALLAGYLRLPVLAARTRRASVIVNSPTKSVSDASQVSTKPTPAATREIT